MTATAAVFDPPTPAVARFDAPDPDDESSVDAIYGASVYGAAVYGED